MGHRAPDNSNGHLLILTRGDVYLCCGQRVPPTARGETWKEKRELMKNKWRLLSRKILSVNPTHRLSLQVIKWSRKKLSNGFGHRVPLADGGSGQEGGKGSQLLSNAFPPLPASRPFCTPNLPASFQLLMRSEKGL